MAQPTNIYSVYDASGAGGVGLGLRESLADKIWNISPTDSPFVSAIAKESAEAVFEEWQTDALAAATTANAAIDGDDATLAAPSPTVRVGNRCQILTKSFGVTGTLEAVKKAGRARELGYQLSKKSAELKRDLETICLANQASVTGNDTTARRLGGLPAWLTTATSFGAAGADGGFTAGNVVARTDGTPRAFTQALMDGVIQTSWEEGGRPTLIMAGAKQRTVFSGFDGITSAQFHEVKDKAIVGVADVYMSNFGELRMVANRYIRKVSSIDYDVFGIDPEMASLKQLRPFFVKELAVTGDSEKRLLVWEGTLCVKNEAAHWLVTDLN